MPASYLFTWRASKMSLHSLHREGQSDPHFMDQTQSGSMRDGQPHYHPLLTYIFHYIIEKKLPT